MIPKLLLHLAAVFALVAATQAEYTTIQSQFNATNALRVKKHANGEICNGGTEHYTGWMDIGSKHIFYWLHPARHGNFEDAPVVVWLQGGPGGSSLTGLFVENGPCLFDPELNSTSYNPYSWTEYFNMLYIDQPVGVGFSYIDGSPTMDDYPRRSEESALDFILAIKLFYEGFQDLAANPLHISGESYAGRYVPEYAAAILDYNERAPAGSQIPLTSIMVGNGHTSPKEQTPSLYDVGCFEYDGIPPIFNDSTCEIMSAASDRCETLLESCVSVPDELVCRAAGEFCDANILGFIESNLANRYNRVERCKAPGQCYGIMDHLVVWMNGDVVLNQLEVRQQISKSATYEFESEIIAQRYKASGDYYISTVPALQRVLNDNGVGVLYYTGIQDWICNWLGLRRMASIIKWKNHAKFRASSSVALPWNLEDGSSAGKIQRADGFWLVELRGAGHLAPLDQPESCLKLVEAWMSEMNRTTRRSSLDIELESSSKSSKQQYLGYELHDSL